MLKLKSQSECFAAATAAAVRKGPEASHQKGIFSPDWFGGC